MDSAMKCAKCGTVNGDLRYQVLFHSGAAGYVCRDCYEHTHPTNRKEH